MQISYIYSIIKSKNLIKKNFIDRKILICREMTKFYEENKRLKVEDLSQYSECFVTGTAAEVTPVKSINELQFNPGNVCRLLIEKYTQLTLS